MCEGGVDTVHGRLYIEIRAKGCIGVHGDTCLIWNSDRLGGGGYSITVHKAAIILTFLENPNLSCRLNRYRATKTK
jgi:hypothetical protein